MTSPRRPEALVSSPAENTRCDNCERLAFEERVIHGVRYPGDVRGVTFAHCPECGSTDLTDDRSPFEVLAEAIANWEAATDVEVKMGRFDVVFRVAAVEGDPEHCSDCHAFAARAQRALVAMA